MSSPDIRRRGRRALLALSSLLWLTGTPSHAETPEEKGRRIASEAADRDAGFGSYVATGAMILRDRQGNESLRRFRAKTLEVVDDGDKSLIVFDWPRDIARTGVLTVAHKEGDDDQWLFLPALNRVKRISGSNRSGPFVGSEFSYEDLISPDVAKFTYRWLRDEPCPDAPDLACHVNERRPTDGNSGYTVQVVWLDQDELRIHKIDYYDRKSELLKTMTTTGYNKYKGRHWRPGQALMVNHQNGKSTTMSWTDYDFTVNLNDGEFTTRALERVN